MEGDPGHNVHRSEADLLARELRRQEETKRITSSIKRRLKVDNRLDDVERRMDRFEDRIDNFPNTIRLMVNEVKEKIAEIQDEVGEEDEEWVEKVDEMLELMAIALAIYAFLKRHPKTWKWTGGLVGTGMAAALAWLADRVFR